MEIRPDTERGIMDSLYKQIPYCRHSLEDETGIASTMRSSLKVRQGGFNYHFSQGGSKENFRLPAGKGENVGPEGACRYNEGQTD